MLRRLVVGVAVGALAASLAARATAQTAVAQAGPTSVGEVVVTAERRAESEQNVAISMTVLNAQSLDQEGVIGVNDLQNA